MREWLRTFSSAVVENLHFKLFSVIIAVAAWWYVQASDIDQRPVRVSVEWLMPIDLVSAEPLPSSVVAVVSGSRHALRRVDESALLLTVDLAKLDVEMGDHRLELSASDVRGLPVSVVATDVRPPSVAFTLDQVEIRRVMVQPVLVGEPREGWNVQEVKVDPSVVELRGPRVVLMSAQSVDTEPIDISGLRHDKRYQVKLVLPRGVEVRGPAEVEARVDVEPMVEARVFDEVPIFIRGYQGYRVEPSTVRVFAEGPSSALRQIRDRDVVSQVYFPEAPARNAYVVPFGPREGVRAEVVLPAEGVRVVRVEPAEVKVVRP